MPTRVGTVSGGDAATINSVTVRPDGLAVSRSAHCLTWSPPPPTVSTLSWPTRTSPPRTTPSTRRVPWASSSCPKTSRRPHRTMRTRRVSARSRGPSRTRGCTSSARSARPPARPRTANRSTLPPPKARPTSLCRRTTPWPSWTSRPPPLRTSSPRLHRPQQGRLRPIRQERLNHPEDASGQGHAAARLHRRLHHRRPDLPRPDERERRADREAHSEKARIRDLGNPEKRVPALCEGFADMTPEQVAVFPSDTNAGRFKVTASRGFNAEKGCFDELHTFDGRSHDFVGFERVGGAVAYDVTGPHAPRYKVYVNNRGISGAPDDLDAIGDVGPEGLRSFRPPTPRPARPSSRWATRFPARPPSSGSPRFSTPPGPAPPPAPRPPQRASSRAGSPRRRFPKVKLHPPAAARRWERPLRRLSAAAVTLSLASAPAAAAKPAERSSTGHAVAVPSRIRRGWRRRDRG